MADANDRIERFKYMADADPGNELAHFSLGREYLNAGLPEQGIDSLRRALNINRNLSRAYQMIATAQLKLGKRDDAVATLAEGVKIADSRGEVLPRNEMIDMLKAQGAPVPELASAGAGAAARQVAGEGEVLCRRCGKIGKKLARQPFRNDFGKLVYESICADCWREAVAMGTKVINELRLDMSDPRAQTMWDQNIREFLNLT
jgi:Fe-S cluster biosynthesis and repair protein YggX